MSNPKWPEALHAVAHALWRDGHTWAQIATQTGVPVATLRNWKHREAWHAPAAQDAEHQTAADLLATIRLSVTLLAIHLQSRLTRPDALADLSAPEMVLSLQRLVSALKDAADVLPLVDLAGFDQQLQTLSAMLPELGLSEAQQAAAQAAIDAAVRTRLDRAPLS